MVMEGRVQSRLWRYGLAAAVCAAAVSVLFWGMTVGLLVWLRPLAAGFTDNDVILRALESVRNGKVLPPLWWTIPAGLLLFGGGLLIRRAWRREPRRRLQAALWGTASLVFLLLAFFFSLWMTRVNSVPVHTIITVLQQYITSGALSGL